MPEKGGTQMQCPECEEVRVCAAIPTSTLGYEAGQRWYSTKYRDIHWFRRGRECQSCEHSWLTAEIREDFLEELMELRDALGDLKQNAERYLIASQEAGQSLADLSESLEVLRALRIYQDQT